ncbi:hypothetical protein L6452_33342 [Arctium lappa]|uniref:Uncharacterized protein n=1 Tax=Arctium lappa TaxID=4217 RepID=A0ACB8YG33_ARCLA|nr:hypothetical protein L6452_33342 [Arctium lappa]
MGTQSFLCKMLKMQVHSSIILEHYMAAGSSSSDHLFHIVDDFYFSALHDDDEIFPISDEKYAEELQLQEALISSSSSSASVLLPPSPFQNASSSSSKKQPMEESETSFCEICFDRKTASEMFHNINVCGHLFCLDCIRGHVAAKIKENITQVKCPDPKCQGLIGPEICRSIVPKQVLERWEDSLCESMILGSEKFYCPLKDCSAMLVDDGGGEIVTSSECPNCNRLFCAQCKVVWHSGMDCREFQSLKKGERNPEDIMLMELAKNNKWRRCPSCNFFVEKTDGCLHISCRCGYHFCYGCGKEHHGKELQLHEALMFSTALDQNASSSSSFHLPRSRKHPLEEISKATQIPDNFCEICMDTKTDVSKHQCLWVFLLHP